MAKKKKPEPLKELSALAAQNPGPLSAMHPDGGTPPISDDQLPEGDESSVHDETHEMNASDLVDENDDVEENEDGSATVTMDDGEDPDQMNTAEFGVNLATVLPEHVLDELATKYMTRIEDAIRAREARDRLYEEGLKRAGLGGPAPGGAEFEGASRVTHPAMAEAYIDFSAASMKELFPPNGPVRIQIDGQMTADKLDKAQRKRDYMNRQLTKEIPEYRSELEVLLTQLPAGGSQFLKIYWSGSLDRVVVDFVGVDEFILPFNAKGFDRAPYRFHRLKKDEYEMQADIDGGLYRDVAHNIIPGFDDETMTETQTNKIEGKDYNWGANEDGEFIVFEGTVMEDSFDDPKRPESRQCPYILTLDEGSNKILSLYRNWDEVDKKCEDIPYMVEFKFIPWRGAYGLGLPHLIGDLSAALTGALRALLDSAHIQNSATAIKLKGRPGGETVSASPTQISEIDALAGDDIRKIIMPMQFNGPSPVLFQLLGWLDAAAKGVVSTSEEKIADAGNEMPVGTAMALIEQGAKVYSSIHARMHESQMRALTIIHRLNYKHMPDKVQFGTDDRDFVMKEEFAGPLDIHPVSDPNIFSETQRYAQMQAVMAMAEKAPNIMNLQKCFERMLVLMKIPDYKELLMTPPPPQPQNPAAENVQMAMGKSAPAFPDEDHIAHIQVHLDFLKNPLFGLNQVIGLKMIPLMIEHVKQHMLFYYANLMQLESKQRAGQDVAQMTKNDKSWQTNRNVSEHLAHSSPVVMEALKTAFEGIPPVIKQAMDFMQAQQHQMQQDPAYQIAMAELQQRKVEHTDEMKLENQRLMQGMKKMMADQQLRVEQLQQNMEKWSKQFEGNKNKVDTESTTDIAKTHMQGVTKMLTTKDDNATAVEIAEMRGKGGMTDGGSMTQH